jgi:Concanavalin A-like lectin/glucanases superfamily
LNTTQSTGGCAIGFSTTAINLPGNQLGNGYPLYTPCSVINQGLVLGNVTLGATFSYGGWIRLATNIASDLAWGIFGQTSGGYANGLAFIEIQNTGTTYQVNFGVNAGGVNEFAYNYLSNQWIHLYLVFSSEVLTLYVNGTLALSQTSANFASTYTKFPLLLGFNDNANIIGETYYYDIRLHNLALGPYEIANAFQYSQVITPQTTSIICSTNSSNLHSPNNFWTSVSTRTAVGGNLNISQCQTVAVSQSNVCGAVWLNYTDTTNYGLCQVGETCCLLVEQFPCPYSSSTGNPLPGATDILFQTTCTGELTCSANNSVKTGQGWNGALAADTYPAANYTQCMSLAQQHYASHAFDTTGAYVGKYVTGWTYLLDQTFGGCSAQSCCFLTYEYDYSLMTQSYSSSWTSGAYSGIVLCSYTIPTPTPFVPVVGSTTLTNYSDAFTISTIANLPLNGSYTDFSLYNISTNIFNTTQSTGECALGFSAVPINLPGLILGNGYPFYTPCNVINQGLVLNQAPLGPMFSYGGWIRLATNIASDVTWGIFGQTSGGYANGLTFIEVENTGSTYQVNFGLNNGGVNEYTYTYISTEWTHIYITFGTELLNLYINGSLALSQTSNAFANTYQNFPLLLGFDDGANVIGETYYYNIRIHNLVLGPSDIALAYQYSQINNPVASITCSTNTTELYENNFLTSVPPHGAIGGNLNSLQCIELALSQSNVCGGVWLNYTDSSTYGTCEVGETCCLLIHQFPCPYSTNVSLPGPTDFIFQTSCKGNLICDGNNSVIEGQGWESGLPADAYPASTYAQCITIAEQYYDSHAYDTTGSYVGKYATGWSYVLDVTYGACTAQNCCILTYAYDYSLLIPSFQATGDYSGVVLCAYH